MSFQINEWTSACQRNKACQIMLVECHPELVIDGGFAKVFNKYINWMGFLYYKIYCFSAVIKMISKSDIFKKATLQITIQKATFSAWMQQKYGSVLGCYSWISVVISA